MLFILRTEIIYIKLTANNITTFCIMKLSVAIYFYVNLSPCATKNWPRYSRKRLTVVLFFIILKAKLSWVLLISCSSWFFPNSRFVKINIESKARPPFRCVFRAQTSLHLYPQGWLLSCCLFRFVLAHMFTCFCSVLM